MIACVGMKLGCGEYFTNWLSTSSFNKFWKFFELWIHLKLGGLDIRGHDSVGDRSSNMLFVLHSKLDHEDAH